MAKDALMELHLQ